MKKNISMTLIVLLVFRLFFNLPGNIQNVKAAQVLDAATGLNFDTETGAIISYSGSATELTIPNMISGVAVTSINDLAFSYNDKLTSLILPNSITEIGIFPFLGCNSLLSIEVDELNLNFTSIDQIIYSKDKTKLVTCLAKKTGSITIPNSVTSIGYGAFYNCSSLTSIIIPNSVTDIGDRAFGGCSSLTSIIIPDGVTSIGHFTFFGCSSLTSIIIPDSVISFGENVFSDYASLTIYGKDPSSAKTYADAQNPKITFIPLSIPQSSTMQYVVAPSYIVIIPSSVAIGDEGGTMDITSSNINTLPNEAVFVKISEGIDNSGNIILKNQSDISQIITSNITRYDVPVNNQMFVAYFHGFITTPTIGGTLIFSKPSDTNGKKVGTYTGTLIFTIGMGQGFV